MVTAHPDQAATRQRLLDAAGEVFAQAGFRAATVRDICRRAGANGAAVNYHFGDKQRLYAAVFHYAYDCALAKHPTVADAESSGSPALRLRAFVRAFLLRILDQGRPAWHGKLMAREMVEPTGALDQLVEKSIRPQFTMLAGIVRDLLGELPPAALRRCAASVVAQCLFYHHSRPVIARLFPDLAFDEAEIEALSEHIATFSLAGLARAAQVPPAAKRSAKTQPRRRPR